MPDSWNSAGELIAPAERITSPFALTVSVLPARTYSTPVALPSSSRMRVTTAPVTTATFPRRIAGARNAVAADLRTPDRVVI